MIFSKYVFCDIINKSLKIGGIMVQKNKKENNKHGNNMTFFVISMLVFAVILFSVLLKSKMGILGEYTAKFVFIFFGLAAYIFPFFLIYLLFAIRNKEYLLKYRYKIINLFIIFMFIMLIISTKYTFGITFKDKIINSYNQAINYTGVGVIFTTIYFLFNILIADIGIYIFSLLIFFLSYFVLFDKSILKFLNSFKDLFLILVNRLSVYLIKSKHNINEIENNFEENVEKIKQDSSFEDEKEEDFNIDYHYEISDNISKPLPILEVDEEEFLDNDNFEKEIYSTFEGSKQYENDIEDVYIKPSLSLLSTSKPSNSDSSSVLENNASIIESTLRSFGIESKVVNINSGPTVTSYEVKPQVGVKVSKIVNLSNDLALALARSGIRIEAPIPGKPYVGIEVPNINKDIVTFRELLFTDDFQNENDDITVALGKNLFGKPIYANINEMPHLLVAGATGAGKSVLVNIIIMSIIFKYSPKDVQFIMIDPKMVELNVYNGIPHLSNRKVITDATRATNALKYAVDEMVERFEKFSKISCRDIKGYNMIAKERGISKMPYFVVIIDELSDLMMESSKDVEAHITRLAQMGRASGIHLIIATQRPSVDVITGVIKANIPSRISFQVSSQIDSRTVLDMAGAEKLLGKGDMLYFPAKFPKPVRVQGAFISDKEVENVVNFIKNENIVSSDENFNEAMDKSSYNNEILEDMDVLLNDAIEFVIRENQASISAIQRRFRVGYARAGRIVDQMEKLGIVGEHDGSKPRKILKDISYLEKKDKEEENEILGDEFSEQIDND